MLTPHPYPGDSHLCVIITRMKSNCLEFARKIYFLLHSIKTNVSSKAVKIFVSRVVIFMGGKQVKLFYEQSVTPTHTSTKASQLVGEVKLFLVDGTDCGATT